MRKEVQETITCLVVHPPARVYLGKCEIWIGTQGATPTITEKGQCAARMTGFRRDAGNGTLWHVSVAVENSP
jgi:hypothetical protein